MPVGKKLKMAGVLLLATMAACFSVGAACTHKKKSGLLIKKVSAEKVEGQYHGATGNIQFSSEVRGGDRSLTVATMDSEGGANAIIVSMKKPERASMMTMRLQNTKFLVEENKPGSGLPRYSDYVVPQAFHNLMDVALMQNRVSYTLLQQLERRNTNETRRRAIEDLVTRSEANSIVEAAKALGNAGVMGTDNPAAQQFYVLAMRLMKIKDMMMRGAVASVDGTLPTGHSGSIHPMYVDEQETCPQCTTGRCPYMGDQSNDCNGMCGRKCSCWSYVCGDCCVHQGCLDHDNCCARDGYFSYSCTAGLALNSFSCSGYSC